jgi:hypothetical protein
MTDLWRENGQLRAWEAIPDDAQWVRKAAEDGDIAEVVATVVRDDTGINYGIDVALRSLAASAYEMGEDRRGVWSMRVEFGTSAHSRAGGLDFQLAAKRQERLAARIAQLVWEGK